MKRRFLQFSLVLAMMALLSLSHLSSLAQSGSQGFTGIWVTKTTITRKPKPDRIRQTQNAAPKNKKNTASATQREKARLLTIQWRVLKQSADGKAIEVNPESTFYTGDRLRFAVKVNQDGFLYIIQNTEGDEGETIFPDARINGGQNAVKRDVEYVLPFNCDADHKDDCWYLMEPPDGREAITVIFSRDKITSLPNDAKEAGNFVKKQIISSIKASSPEPLRNNKPTGLATGRFVTWVTNTNVQDNEELVSTFYLTHATPQKNN
jgi:hypothetical protein